MTYDKADEIAARLAEAGKHRIVFVTEDITVSHAMRYDYAVMNYGIIGMRPVKRYRRLTTGAIEVKAVTNWRRN